MSRRLILSIVFLMSAGCSLPFSGETEPRRYFVLQSEGAPETATAEGTLRLLVKEAEGSRLADTHGIVFSRDASELSLFQYASWVETPAEQLTDLLLQSLSRSSEFSVVSRSNAGVVGALQLSAVIRDFVYDLSATPAVVRVRVSAELLDLRDRNIVGAREFAAQQPVEDENVESAVKGFSVASSELIRAISGWTAELAHAHNPNSLLNRPAD